MTCRHCDKRLIGYLLNPGSNEACDECRQNVDELAEESNLIATLRAELAEARERLATAEADSRRLDWLEGEMQREQRLLRHTDQKIHYSLFRQNVPITRAAIDAAMSEGDQ